MRTITIIACLFYSITVQAQPLTGQLKTAKIPVPVKKDTSSIKLSTGTFTLPPLLSQSSWGVLVYNTKPAPLDAVYSNWPVMTVSSPDSSGVYKIWFDPKKVKFTSDSTFTLKTK